MLINQSQTTFYLDKDGNATEDASAGVTLLLAPGGSIDEAVAKKYGIDGDLTPHGDAELTNPVTGEPIVLVGGRAYAKKLIEGDEAEGPARKAPRAQSKSIKSPPEDKGVAAPEAAVGLSQPPKGGDKK